MRGLVLAFDALFGLLSAVYILLFVLAPSSPSAGLLLGISRLERVSDLLLSSHLAPDYFVEPYLYLLGPGVCHPPSLPCSHDKDWSCGSWVESRVQDGRVVFERAVVCVEAGP